jgi:thymidylate synthase
MYITAPSIDDLMRRVLTLLLKSDKRVRATRGSAAEECGVLLKVRNPRCRLSRTESRGQLFSAIGELLWYLAGSNDVDFITYYTPAYKDEAVGGRVYGGYGPRLMNRRCGGGSVTNQIENVIRVLTLKRESRRAVIQLFDAEDIVDPSRPEVPCTCTLQFLVRGGRLNLISHLRSNDAYLGLPHDVFAFTMIQEIVARRLGVEVGSYKHMVGSLHLYDKRDGKKEDWPALARRFLAEGYPEAVEMPAMPLGDPMPKIGRLLKIEAKLRRGESVPAAEFRRPGYWGDLARLLKIFRHVKNQKTTAIGALKAKMSTRFYNVYIQRKQRPRAAAPIAKQLALEFTTPSDNPAAHGRKKP